jgi:hypothetical protein
MKYTEEKRGKGKEANRKKREKRRRGSEREKRWKDVGKDRKID